ncbi:RagB/SusD family nutrient uptake outer membrane protein [Daejeonella oryzae]|uniref:RagB/SusD family nutrient uptake outer membrane protein n=1 Tax=Daejeonella oryzae TaxID=1122943 RepID=UPI000416A993|nr:RagB/SusD family nutrient uptake outer membrane protein [Daejeonella oryzae]
MKRFNIQAITAVTAGLLIITACQKDFLEVDPKGTLLESTYYQNPDQAFAGLVAAYDPMGFETVNTYHNFGALNSASDDHVAGGGGSADMETWQVWSNYTLDPSKGPQGDYWNRNFTGVSRTNVLLSKIETGIPGLDAATTSRYTAEAKFLRAYYYFDLVRLFKNVPLFTAPVSTDEIYNATQVAPELIYAQVEKDLADAIPNLPLTVPAAMEGGRVTQGTAKALLGKVLLYQKKWTAAAQQFAEVNGTPGGTSKYGYKLLTNFADIFKPNNKFNSESILEIVKTTQANSDWGSWGRFEGNVAVTMFGPRGYSGPIYVSGWSFNPFLTDFVNIMKKDPRYPYTVADVDSLEKIGKASYEKGYLNSGYFIEKFAPKLEYQSKGGGIPELNWPNDYIEIRLADTYLMEAEALVQGGGDLVRAAALLNAVRSRVGLNPTTATLDNIYLERRLELASEGHRWYDLVRTGRAASVLASRGFKAGKHEILPVPLSELTNTKLVQNPGY